MFETKHWKIILYTRRNTVYPKESYCIPDGIRATLRLNFWNSSSFFPQSVPNFHEEEKTLIWWWNCWTEQLEIRGVWLVRFIQQLSLITTRTEVREKSWKSSGAKVIKRSCLWKKKEKKEIVYEKYNFSSGY